MRDTGTYVTSTTLGESVRAFVPHPLPPVAPVLSLADFAAPNHAAELALARLSGVSGLVPSVDWLLYGAIRKEALLTSQIEGTQATLADLFDEEAGFAVSNVDDVEEVTNYLICARSASFRKLPTIRPVCRSACACCAMSTVYCSTARVTTTSSRVNCAVRRTGSAAPGGATPLSFRRRPNAFPNCSRIWSDFFTPSPRRRCRRRC